MKIEEWSDLRIALTVIGSIGAVVVFLMFCVYCTETKSVGKDQCAKEYMPMNVKVFSYHGHEYFYNYHGGIVHTESCQCHERNAAK